MESNRVQKLDEIEHPLWFIHIPKTAGSAITQWLWEDHGLKRCSNIWRKPGTVEQLPFSAFDQTGHVSFVHAAPSALLAKGIVSKEYYDRAWKVAVVRHPLRRMISMLGRHVNPFTQHAKWRLKRIVHNFVTAIRWDAMPDIGCYSMRMCEHKEIDSRLQPMWKWLIDDSGNCHADDLYYFQNVEQLVNDICERYGWDVPKLRRINISRKHYMWQKYLRDADLRVVLNFYRRDFKNDYWKFRL